MARAVYSIEHRDGAWRLLCNRHPFGSFPSRAAATKIAIETAAKAGRFNSDGAIVIAAETGMPERVIWTYGDAVPAGAA
jgi:hypothetical protein